MPPAKKLQIYDLTHALNSTTQTYPGGLPFRLTAHKFAPTDGYNVSSLSFSSHTGTHLDAPYHFFQDGKKIDELDLGWLVGRAVIVDLEGLGLGRRAEVGWADVKAILEGVLKKTEGSDDAEEGEDVSIKIALFHTSWQRHYGTPVYYAHPYLSREIAEHLVELGVKVVGVDSLSPDATYVDSEEREREGKGKGDPWGVHEVVLGSGGVIVEDLMLGELVAALRVRAADGLGPKERMPLAGDVQIYEVNVSLLPLKISGCDGAPVRAVAWPL